MFVCSCYGSINLFVSQLKKKQTNFDYFLISIFFLRYHIGFFRTHQPPAAAAVQNPAVVAPINNNNIIENNNNPAQAVPVAEVVGPQQADVIADENQTAAVTNDEVTADETTTRTSVMALIRTFVLSFFTSLIPETPAL